MSDRPYASAALLPALTALVPARLAKKLDANPRAALAWTWTKTAPETWTIATDSGETVTLRSSRLESDGKERSVVLDASAIACTCLLAPRCFHLLAVAAALAIDDGDAPKTSAIAASNEAIAPAPSLSVPLREDQRAAARAAWNAAEHVVGVGAAGTGTVAESELLRAVHTARTLGLHRLAAAALRVVRDVRALRDEKPEFAIADLSDDLEELLATAWALVHAGESVASAWLGEARRSYELVGNLRLFGLFTEPVIANGYAGVVTYVCDERARIWTINDIMPGPPSRAVTAYAAAAKMGDTSVPHEELVRSGLFLQDATGSTSMRLGAGSSVKAVRSSVTSLDDAAPNTLWDALLDLQITRAYGALAIPFEDRPSAATLLFGRGTIVGTDGSAVIVAMDVSGAPPFALRLAAPSDHAELAFRDNLRLLARAPGLRLRFAGHVVHETPRTIAVIAVGSLEASDPSAPLLRLPREWGGRVCLGLDRLQTAHLERAEKDAPHAAIQGSTRSTAWFDPLHPMRRRIHRLALGGRSTIPPGAVPVVDSERARLEKTMLPTASALLDQLAKAAIARRSLGVAWLTASAYERGVTRELRASTWLTP